MDDDDEILQINVTSKAFLALLAAVITGMFYVGREVVTRRDLASELTDFRTDIKLKIDKETKNLNRRFQDDLKVNMAEIKAIIADVKADVGHIKTELGDIK